MVAIAAVCVFGASLVTREQVTTPSERARTAFVMPTPTRIWSLEARWWAGDRNLQAATNSNTELTFAKGYQLRLAARQAAATTVALAPSTETQPSDAKATTVARAETVPLPKPRRVAVARIEPPVERPTRFDPRAATLAYGEQRPSPQAFFAAPRNPFNGLFGSTY